MKTYGKVWIWTFVLTLMIGGLGVAVMFGSSIFKPAHTANQIVDKTLDANNVLATYEQFHDLYQKTKQQVVQIQDAEDSIKRLKDTYGTDATAWAKDTREQYDFLNQNLDGYKSMYNRLVAEYNANSQKVNKSIFKGKSLPEELPLQYTGFPMN